MRFFTASTVKFAICALLPLLVSAQDYYKILDIDKSASEKDIKRAYRKLSKKYHPDKNPDDPSAAEKFREVAEAYSTLSDSTLRNIYDTHGADGVKSHQSGNSPDAHHDPFDLFSRFFGSSGHFGHHHHSGVRVGPAMEVKITLPLRDFYTGAEKDFSIEKTVLCDECHGSGSADGETATCMDCGGRGVRLTKHMLAPGIFQQMQSVCGKCGGEGKVIRNPCKVCKGRKTLRKVVDHTLVLERGFPKGGRVTFDGEGDEGPDFEPGDLIVHVDEATPDGKVDEENEDEVEHGPTDGMWFRRKEERLYWKEVLSLREALLGGWTRNVTHLDGHVVKLGREEGVTVQPGFVEMVGGEGMPVWEGGETERRGDLVVEYVVVLPDLMEKGMRKELGEVFEKWRKKGGVEAERELGVKGVKEERERDEL
ncbi:DnaJ-domain-containing protein [Ascodesmis nigricans]|uniref:DnaJ-domain-containing protein n=1 Tax=Ascodesmis nigricans TaxID=341454 RepID=A0A4S2MXQ3_9PEZI|nr:DnaJ-domain-containing protein [Ascodesmis nigricans]